MTSKIKRPSKRIVARDFVIRIRPELDKKKNWNGAVDVVIITDKKNPMVDADYYEVLHLTKLMCATVPMMEDDEDLRLNLNDYVITIDKEYENSVQQKTTAKVDNVEDNVIHITFASETKGNAQ